MAKTKLEELSKDLEKTGKDLTGCGCLIFIVIAIIAVIAILFLLI